MKTIKVTVEIFHNDGYGTGSTHQMECSSDDIKGVLTCTTLVSRAILTTVEDEEAGQLPTE